jgi:signal transduction histidine kinase
VGQTMGERQSTQVLEREPDLGLVVEILEKSASELRLPAAVIEAANRRAVLALEAVGGDSEAGADAMLQFAADIISAVSVELAARPVSLERLLAHLEEAAGVNRVRLGRVVLSSPLLFHLPTAVALEVELALLRAFSRCIAASLWTLPPGGDLKHLAHAGDFSERARPTRQLARKLLSEAPAHPKAPPTQRKGGNVMGVVLDRRNATPAAVICTGHESSLAERLTLMEAAGPILAAILGRDELLTRRSGLEDLAASSERRLARVRFDLHDGPQQDVILLGEDLHLFRSQLESVLDGNPDRQRMLGRLDDFQAQLVAIDGDLRRISVAVESPFMQTRSFRDTFAQIADEFAERAGIEPEVSLEGDFSQLTDSQYITLIGLIREALSNIREHSDASNVLIELSVAAGGVEATVCDDGRGFDPAKTLVRAAKGGHLGLVSMHERVRMLGGRTQIDSRPGGPTVISISLPPAPEGVPRQTG